MRWKYWSWFSILAWVAMFVPQQALAQLAPTGGHYGGKSSDTGYAGQVGASGGCQASVPLDLPPARNGLPIPIQLSYSERGVGAAGAGWDIPLSYIKYDATYARHRPFSISGQLAEPTTYTLMLEGREIRLVQVGADYMAQRDAPDLKLHKDSSGWELYDGQGRTYTFQSLGASYPWWYLTSIAGPGGNSVQINYATGSASVAGATNAVSLDVDNVKYNPDATGCYKNTIALKYDAPAELLAVSLAGGATVARMHKLTGIDVTALTACGAAPTILRSYQLQYGSDGDTALPRLSTVQMTGRQGTPEASTPVLLATYTYGSVIQGGQLAYQAAPVISAPGAYPLGSTQTDTSPHAAAGVGYSTNRLLLDVNSDGRPELIADGRAAVNTPSFSGAIQFTPAATLLSVAPLETRTAHNLRYDQFTEIQDDGMVWRQAIDFDGDGRVDIVDAAEEAGVWAVYLNTGNGWQRRAISTTALGQELRSRNLWTGDDFIPLALRSTVRDVIYDVCVVWNGHSWAQYVDEDGVPPKGCPINPHRLGIGPESTITQWELKDVNGDGYPDVVFNSSRLFLSQIVDFPANPTGSISNPIHTTRTDRTDFVPGVANEIDAMFNVTGVHLSTAPTNAFYPAISLFSGASCGIERWAPADSTHQQLGCSLIDVNGDGVVDYVSGTSVFLGQSGPIGQPFFSAGSMLQLPGPLATQLNSQPQSCAPPATSSTTFTVVEQAGLRDMTGDGIPDYVSFDDSGNGYIAVGTGVGFRPGLTIIGTGSLSSEIEDCGGQRSSTTSGFYDLDGDGKADFVSTTPSDPDRISWARVVGSGNIAGAPEAGRLVRIDSGYGSRTSITYSSAKATPSTTHQVPFAEIVVSDVQVTGTQGLGGDLIDTEYAYDGSGLMFDSALDMFRFVGYRRSVELRKDSEQGVAIIRDYYGQVAPFDPYGVAGFGNGQFVTTTMADRYNEYLRFGRPREVSTLRGVFLESAQQLLTTNVGTDNRHIEDVQYEWSSRSFTDGTGYPDVCWEMVFPYDYVGSSTYAISSGRADLCTARGFAYASAVNSWHGTPNLATRSEVRAIDDFGRATQVAQLNDVSRADDDVCVSTTYASPTADVPRVLYASSNRSISDCAGKPLGGDAWEYDGLPVGGVSSGFPTAHTVERRLDIGVYLGTVREFDATYDGSGNPATITSVREDGATRTTSIGYDPFGLAPISITTSASGIPATQTIIARDAATLDVLGTTDANGTQRGTVYDGFGRPVMSTVTPRGGVLGALSTTGYVGFAVGETPARSIASKTFVDPVDPAAVSLAVGHTGRVYLDELGREMRTELDLGADYAPGMLVVGQRKYDKFNRVEFEADPYPGNGSFLAAYGTSYHFNSDGTMSCIVRGNGEQPLTRVTNEQSEIFPTCFQRTFPGSVEVDSVQDAASLLPLSPQAGVTKYRAMTAIGRPIERWTAQGTARLEDATLAYDPLGRLTGMTRYQDPAGGTNPVTTSWHFDSLGQLVELDEPGNKPQMRSYSSWGELLKVSRGQTSGGPPPPPGPPGPPSTAPSAIVKSYDALGRMIHSEQQDSGVTVPETVTDYLYDQGVNPAPQVTATNMVGRLAQAISPTGAVAFSYDGLGQIDARVFTDNLGGTYVERHATHADGSPSTLDLLLPDTGYADEHVDYGYDSAGRGKSVTYTNGAAAQTLFTASSVDVFGRVHQAQFGVATYTANYAATGRQLLHDAGVSSMLGARATTYLGYDPVGRERSRSETKDGVGAGATTTWTYDALGRLATAVRAGGAVSPFSQQFTYDPLGNILGLSDTTSGTGSNSTTLSYLDTDRDRICHVGYAGDTGTDCNVTYDQDGNVTDQPTRTGSRQLSFFADGSVRSVTDGNTSAQFLYDAFGEVQELDLTSATSTDTRHDRRYGGLIAWRDELVGASTLPVLTRTIPGPGGFVATRSGSGGAWTFAFGEDRGNRFFVDDTGAFVQDVDYSPFGEAKSTGAQPGSPLYSHDQWNGGDNLSAFGLSHLGARLYDPVIGRFLSRDPLLIPRTAATTNPYAFAENNPVGLSDPSGMQPPECDPGQSSCTTKSEPRGTGDWPLWAPGGDAGYSGVSGSEHHSYDGPSGGGGHIIYASNGVPSSPDSRALFGNGGTGSIPVQVLDLKDDLDPHSQVENVTASALQVSDAVVPVLKPIVDGVADSLPFLGTYRAYERGDKKAFVVGLIGDLTTLADVVVAVRGIATPGEAVGEVCLAGLCRGPTCFVAGTLVETSHGDIPIEMLKVGDRVEAGDSRCDSEHLSGDMVAIGLEFENRHQAGDIVSVEVARSLAWLHEHMLDDGSIQIDLPELGVSGRGRVIRVSPVSEDRYATGCLVLMTVNHVAESVLRLRFEAGAELEVTPSHRLYVERSTQGSGWLPAGDLAPGMLLRSDRNSMRIKAIEQASPYRRVFNLEVGLAHTYRVTSGHIWAHNNCDIPEFTRKMNSIAKVIRRGTGIQKVEELVAKFGGKVRLWRKMKTWDAFGREIHYYEHPGIGKVGAKWDGELDPF